MIMNCADVIAACCFWYAWFALWWWLRLGDNNCDAGMFPFVRIVMHSNAWLLCLCLICFTCHRIWTFACFTLHCSWNAARDCEDLATTAAVCENILKFYSNSISVHILRLLITSPLFVAKSYFLLLSWTLRACLHLLCAWTTFLSLRAMIVTNIIK